MNRGDSPFMVSFHNPIILFLPVSTVAKMTRIQDSYGTNCAAQTTPEIRKQTSLNPASTPGFRSRRRVWELRASSLSS